jgi:hypothetical protein
MVVLLVLGYHDFLYGFSLLSLWWLGIIRFVRGVSPTVFRSAAMSIEVTRDEFEEILNAMKVIRNLLHKDKQPTVEVENIIAKLDDLKERS